METGRHITYLYQLERKDRDLYIDIVFEFCGLDKPSTIKDNYKTTFISQLNEVLDARNKYLRHGE